MLVATTLASVLFWAQDLRLEGHVTGVGGRALAGASVFVATAQPRRGVGYL